jgi:hypothetical protein
VYQDNYIHFQYVQNIKPTTGEYLDADLQRRTGRAEHDLSLLINSYEHLEHPFLNVVVSVHLAGAGVFLTVVPWLAFPEECAGTGGLGCAAAGGANTVVSGGGLALIYGAYKFTVEETIPSFRHGNGKN